MNKKLRAFLEANGLRADASEQEAWELYDSLQATGVRFEGEIGTRAAAGAAAAAPAAAAVPSLDPALQAQIDAAARAAAAAARAEQSRLITAIDERLQVAGLSDLNGGEFRRSLISDEHLTLERASQLIFEQMRTANRPVGAGAQSRAQVGIESRDKLRAAVTDGLILRSGLRLDTPADGSREFRGRSLVEICREMLEAAGISTRGMGNMEVAGRALTSLSTSDFPLIFSSLVNKNLLAAYNEWPATWRPIVAVGSARDFKLMHALKLSEAPDLLGMNESGEYQTASFSESGESYRVITKGIRVPLTRTMIINDDLRSFTRIPQLFGASARRMESDAVFSLITTNGNMSDGNALFSDEHNNYTGTGTAISSESLGVGRAKMRKQTGMSGAVIDIIPAYLLTSVAKETTAEVLLRSAALPTADMSAGVHNPWSGKLTPIADPRLDVAANTWYLFAHPNQAPVIEVSWLEGGEQPYVEEMVDFNSDTLVTKVRHDFGAGVVDYVGGYKNVGE